MKPNDHRDEGPAPGVLGVKATSQPPHLKRTTGETKGKKVRWAPSTTSKDDQPKGPTPIAKQFNPPPKTYSPSLMQRPLYSDGFMQDGFFTRDFIPSWGQPIDKDFLLPEKVHGETRDNIMKRSSRHKTPVVRQTIPPAVPDAPTARVLPRSPVPARLPTPELLDDFEPDFCDCRDESNYTCQQVQPLDQMAKKWEDDAGDRMKAQREVLFSIRRYPDNLTIVVEAARGYIQSTRVVERRQRERLPSGDWLS